MTQFWRPRPRRPPSPLVEDEVESLSHELGGLSLLGEKPGLEGACERGTVDQYPILLSIETPPRSATADTDVSQSSTLTSTSSRESFGPPTPPPPGVRPQDPRVKDHQRGQYQTQFNYHYQSVRPAAKSDNSRAPNDYRPDQRPLAQHTVDDDIRMNRGIQQDYQYESNERIQAASLRYAKPPLMAYNDDVGQPKRDRPEDIETPRLYKRPTVAELIEERLRSRREPQLHHRPDPTGYAGRQQSTVQDPMICVPAGDGQQKQAALTLRTDAASAPQSPVHTPRVNTDAGQYHASASQPNSPRVPMPRSPLSPNGGAFKAAYRDRRAVSFADDIRPPRVASQSPEARPRITRHESDVPSPRPLHSESLPKHVPARSTDEPVSLALRPCQRSVAVAGYQDWYTITGLSHLNICPSCMNQIGSSRFRDYFIPSLPKPRDVKVRCSFSEHWTRLAWIQTIKKGHDNLDILYHMTRLPPGWSPCPGRNASTQTWYRVIDPRTGENVPKFTACSSCVRSLRLLMPVLRNTFRCQSTASQSICDLAVDSPRFVQYLDLLDGAANECEYRGLASPDHSKFVHYIRRKCDLRDCRRDRLIMSTWHYITDLPEFTICEDCYDDVVQPLAAAHQPIARMVSRSARLLPGPGPTRCREASCQLYSPRMRARFRGAVLDDDYRLLESSALKRFDAERRFRDRKQKLLYDESKGYDIDVELRQIAENWRKVE